MISLPSDEFEVRAKILLEHGVGMTDADREGVVHALTYRAIYSTQEVVQILGGELSSTAIALFSESRWHAAMAYEILGMDFEQADILLMMLESVR